MAMQRLAFSLKALVPQCQSHNMILHTCTNYTRLWVLGFRVQGLGFGVFRVWALALEFQLSSAERMVEESRSATHKTPKPAFPESPIPP